MATGVDYIGLHRDRLVKENLRPIAHICPHCGKNLIDPESRSGRMYGVCETCHLKALTEAKRQIIEENEVRSEYNRVRQRASRLTQREKTMCSDSDMDTNRYYA